MLNMIFNIKFINAKGGKTQFILSVYNMFIVSYHVNKIDIDSVGTP